MTVMDLDTIEDEIKQKIAFAPVFDAKVKLDFGTDGCLLINGATSPPTMTRDDDDADTTLICTIDTFQNIMKGTQDPTMAYMMGKLKIKGSMGLAMKLNSILEG